MGRLIDEDILIKRIYEYQSNAIDTEDVIHSIKTMPTAYEVEAEYGKDTNVLGNGWIPCNRADHPYDGQRVLACINTRIATHEIIITDYNGEIYWFDGTISAWMPLPSTYKPTTD